MGVNNDNSKRLRKAAGFGAIFVLALLIPAVAFAVPGSGDFIALESQSGRDITSLYNTIAKICVVILILVEGLLLVAIIKFRRKSDDEQPEAVHGNAKLEFGWTLAALLIQVYIGWLSVDVMFNVEQEPTDVDMTVEAYARQWDWKFRYPDQGGLISEDLVVPAHANVKLRVTSEDVLHSLSIPDLGVKIDAVPGRYNYFWFNADGPINQTAMDETQRPEREEYVTTRPEWWYDVFPFTRNKVNRADEYRGLEQKVTFLGHSREAGETSPYDKYDAVEYQGTCTELCGTGHYDMYFRTVAMTPNSFKQWVADKEEAAGSADVNGAEIYQARCATCHQADGNGMGSNFPPLAGAKWTTQEDMKEEHIRVVLQGSSTPSLEGPTTVKGTEYSGQMPPQNDLNDAEVAAVVNHERNAWGNDGGEVTSDMVASLREELGLPARPVRKANQVPVEQLETRGEEIYSTCAACHGEDGKGVGEVPSLTNNPTVKGSVDSLAKVLIEGQDTPKWPGVKTPVAADMSDRDLAALLTYLRTAWDNETSPVQPTEIERIREDLD